MSHRYVFLPLIIFFSMFTVSCSKEYIRKVLKDNPEILAEIIEENPKLVIDALNKASMKFRQEQVKQAQKDMEKQREEEFKNPKKPVVSSDRVTLGEANAPITIVEYSDFQCGFCGRAAVTVKQLLEDYKGKVRFIYKHLPNQPQAGIAAQYYEAVAKVDKSKAMMFHDKIFQNQGGLRKGEKFLEGLVKEVGLSPVSVKKHLKEVQSIIEEDRMEAQKFGFTGTPSFLIGGVSISGAQDISQFKKIIDRHLGGMEKK